ncbi:baseplate J/gp47 family protein [Streptomyces sp. CA-135486]|uniref:baseplate J/gp47 family protein n=1 Tax=Streptomyces sp. CA-135486 TaxID=3240049 RepID=UPI003D8B744B
MPLFPPLIDTLRWADLVRAGRAQLPLVAPGWTDQNPSDPGIALLELLTWLVEADGYRAGAVTDRERHLLLALIGDATAPARPATCLLRFTVGPPGPARIPAGLVLTGRRDDSTVPLTLLDDVIVSGAAITALASAEPGAAEAEYRSGGTDLTDMAAAGLPVPPFGPEPSVGCAFLVGLEPADGAALPTGTELDLWAVTEPGTGPPEAAAAPGPHHSARTEWEVWDGAAWVAVGAAGTQEDTAALTRSGRVRLTLPVPAPRSVLGDPVAGALAGRLCSWVRCRLVAGIHDAGPSLAAIHVNAGAALAAMPFASVLGTAAGVPDEAFTLPAASCGPAPTLGCLDPDGTRHAVRLVRDQAEAGPRELAAHLEDDAVTVRFGDGRTGRLLTPGARVTAAGTWTTAAGVGELRPPMAVDIPQEDRPPGLTGAELLTGLEAGSPAETIDTAAARVERRMWVHDRLTDALRRAGATSLDELPLEAVRELDVPERAVTGPDFERLALATPGTLLRRARALPETDARLPGLVADGCVTVVIVPHLPPERPEPSPGLLARVRARLEAARTLGTQVFVTGPQYVSVAVSARLVPLPDARAEDVVAAASAAVERFLHPISGGPAGRGWPFGRAVRRTELLQLLDSVPGVDHVGELTLTREPGTGDCGDITICPFQLVLAGTLNLTTVTPGRTT